VLAHDCALLAHSGRCEGASGGDSAVAVTDGAHASARPSAAPAVPPGEATTFTAVGAFHSASDHVLLLDVFRPNPIADRPAGPVWVPLRSLVNAMRCPPGDEHYCHGYLRLRRRAASPILLFHQLLLGDAALELATRHGASGGRTGLHGQGDCHGGSCAANAPVGLFAFCDEGGTPAAASRLPSLVPRSPAPCFQRRRYGMAAHWSDSWRSGMGAGAEGWSVDAMLSRPTAVEAIVAAFLARLPGWEGGVLRGTGNVSVASPVAKCIDKLSQQHITETSALLTRLEETRAYPVVLGALQRQLALRGAHDVIAEAATGEAIASGLTSTTVAELSGGDTAGGELMTGYMQDECGPTQGGDGRPGGASIASLLASLEQSNCAGCGVSCVRINIAHVITVREEDGGGGERSISAGAPARPLPFSLPTWWCSCTLSARWACAKL
jgi:hypothetical protein